MDSLKEVETYLLDMDGTIFLGDELIEGALDFLSTIKAKGKNYIFLTNNSSASRLSYVKKLRSFGIDVDTEQIFTSGEATARYLNKTHDGARVYLLGTPALEEEFRQHGVQIVKERHQEIDFVVLGFDTTLTYDKLWGACEYIVKGIPYIATHPDVNCPLPKDQFMPDAGAMAAFIEASTGKRPIVIGKPSKEIVERIAEKYHLSKSAMVMVGDRLYTDIQGGINAGIATAVVFSGETKEEHYFQSKLRADFAFPSVKEMVNEI